MGANTPVPCIGTCGSQLAFVIFPAVAFFVGAVLLNVVKSILLSGIRCPQCPPPLSPRTRVCV
jgi:hypothetical protein